MLEDIKKKAKSNWKTTLLLAIAVGIGTLIGQTKIALSVADGMVDEDIRAEICEGYEPDDPEVADE